MHMRTALIIDDELLERARELSGIREKTALVRAGLEAHRQGGRKTSGAARRHAAEVGGYPAAASGVTVLVDTSGESITSARDVRLSPVSCPKAWL